MHRVLQLACILLLVFSAAALQGDVFRGRKVLEGKKKVPKNDEVKFTTDDVLTKRTDKGSKSTTTEDEEDEDVKFIEEERTQKISSKSSSEFVRLSPSPKSKSSSEFVVAAGKSSSTEEDKIEIEEIADLDDEDDAIVRSKRVVPEETSAQKKGKPTGKGAGSTKKNAGKGVGSTNAGKGVGSKKGAKPVGNAAEGLDVSGNAEEGVDLLENADEGVETTRNVDKGVVKQAGKKKKPGFSAEDEEEQAAKKSLKKKPVFYEEMEDEDQVENKSTKKKPKLGADEKLTSKKNTTKKATEGKKPTVKPGKTKEPTVTFPVGEDVEDLQTDASLPKTATEALASSEDEDDEDFNIDFSSLPTKFHETAGHVAETLGPGLQKISEKTKGYFNSANQQMTESLTPLVGDQVAPVVASLISYAILLVPLIVVLYVLERIRANLSLAKVLFFVNLYMAAYFLTLVLANFTLDREPMAFFFKNSRSSYVFLQLLQAFGYCCYALLYTVVVVKAFSSDTVVQRVLACVQLLLVALFGLHYYVTVFHRAMASKVPRTSWKVYGVYSLGFAVLCLVAKAKIERTKKEYYYTPVDDPDELIPIDKRS